MRTIIGWHMSPMNSVPFAGSPGGGIGLTCRRPITSLEK